MLSLALSTLLPCRVYQRMTSHPPQESLGVVALFLCGVFPGFAYKKKKKKNHEASSCTRAAWKIHGLFFGGAF